MHCPRCGQQQVSEETKFCSRCGFPLGLVSELLFHGGFLPQLADLHKNKKWLTRKNGVVFSLLWFIFFLPLMTIILGGVLNSEILGGISAVLGIFGGLILLIASLVFLKSTPKNIMYSSANELPNANIQGLYSSNQSALPAQTSHPVESYMPPAGAWKAPATGDLARPGSVTEGTTKLLKKDE